MPALVPAVRARYRRHADAARAAAMARYMRDQFPFYGVPSPVRRAIDRAVLAGRPPPGTRELRGVLRDAWAVPEREVQYFACDYVRRHIRRATPALLPALRRAIVTKSWWDTVDTLAAHSVGPLVAAHPSHWSEIDGYAASENPWLIRTAIICQIGAKEHTDTDRLFRYCAAHAGHRDFFIRKAIGWALREHGKTDPDAVRRFVAAHELSPLSIREATRRLGPNG